jgi:hypothetical protein
MLFNLLLFACLWIVQSSRTAKGQPFAKDRHLLRTAICNGPPFAEDRHLQAAGECIFSSSRYGSYMNGPYFHDHKHNHEH